MFIVVLISECRIKLLLHTDRRTGFIEPRSVGMPERMPADIGEPGLRRRILHDLQQRRVEQRLLAGHFRRGPDPIFVRYKFRLAAPHEQDLSEPSIDWHRLCRVTSLHIIDAAAYGSTLGADTQALP